MLKKKQKGIGDYYRDCVPGLKPPGRNYKLLPALAIDSPPDCQCGFAAASRPQRSFIFEKTSRVAPRNAIKKQRVRLPNFP